MANKPRTDVDFSYAFGTPHRLCICMPEASSKTLMDCGVNGVNVIWTDEDLSMAHFPLGAFKSPSQYWRLDIRAEKDGAAMPGVSWKRVQNRIPALEYVWQSGDVTVEMLAVSSRTADVYKVTARNSGADISAVSMTGRINILSFNVIWMEPDSRYNAVTALSNDRSDRILAMAVGAPRPEKLRSAQNVDFHWQVAAGGTETAYFVRPHREILENIDKLLAHDWEAEIAAGIKAWTDLLARAPEFIVPDKMVEDAYYACFADIFVAREKMIDGKLAGTAGTQVYRAMNTVEPVYAAMVLDQAGMLTPSADGVASLMEFQLPNGRWDDFSRWGQRMWWATGYRCWYICEHFKYTNDYDYLREGLKRMMAHARWAEGERAKMKVSAPDGSKPLTWGLMPRGMGDAGLMDDDDLFGVFIVSNVWYCYVLKLAAWAAKTLEMPDQAAEAEAYLKDAWACTLDSIERGAITEDDGTRWIPGVPGKTSGSRFNAVSPLYPCGFMSPDHPLIDGTIKFLEKNISEGGLPLNLGWMKDGLWVAIAIDNLSYAHMARGDFDAAAKYLIPTLNHATPLFTWCEERTPEPGASKIAGDRQHTFTPLSVNRFFRDSLITEIDDVLHIACATQRWWLEPGREISADRAQTYWGRVKYRLSRTADGDVEFRLKFSRFVPEKFVLHVRLPEHDAKITILTAEGCKAEITDVKNKPEQITIVPKQNEIYLKIST